MVTPIINTYMKYTAEGFYVATLTFLLMTSLHFEGSDILPGSGDIKYELS